jgi:hypothetical protein
MTYKYNNMKNLSEKLKSKWTLIIVSILIVFLIKDSIQIFKIPNFNNNVHSTHVGYIAGYIIGISYKAILDLLLIYIVLFKINFTFNKNNIH